MMSKFKIKFVFFLCCAVALSFISSAAFANNLKISNFTVKKMDQAANKITFSCDIDWENSWRTSTNYDAVWVFLKYSTDAGVTWSHASMGANGTSPVGFSAPSNFSFVVPSDEKGFFLQRSDLSSGNVSAKNVQFVWDYGQDGLSDSVATAANTINKIFGIEMVYVPEGAFYAGDGNSSSNFRLKQGTADEDPWYIQSDVAINTGNAASDGFYYQSTGAPSESATGSTFLIPTSFPKGFTAGYYMKYELTEGQWVSFFNTLSQAAKSKRDITGAANGGKNSDSVVNRNTIVWNSNDPKTDATTSRPYRPITYISWADLLAYADWAALRPITELEYEKIARGKDVAPIEDEFAWGKATYNDALSTEIFPDSDEDGTEKISDSTANLNRNNLSWSTGDGRAGGLADSQKGPLRVGIFAENFTNRATSGSGFYGNLELSGNLSEMVVTIARTEGRQFLGTHGDGQLSSVSGYEGNATNIDWPGINTVDAARGVTGTVGSGYRGGDFSSTNIRYFQVSDRNYAVKDADTMGYNQRYDVSSGVFQGGRLGRTAP